MDIEQIVQLFAAIPPSRGAVWSIEPIIEGRLYLSKSEDARPALFLEGEKDSFGPLPIVSALQHSDNVTAIPTGRKLRALRITSANDLQGCRALAHIAYELVWRLGRSPTLSNKEVVSEVSWLFGLLGEARLPMATEKQLGLIGETLFLRRLLQRVHARGVAVDRALDCWVGPDQAKRDFYGNETAVEVKTTGHVARLHHVGSLDQLAPQETNEAVYLFSVGIRQDPTAPKKLTHFVADIESLIVDENGDVDDTALSAVRRKFLAYGFDWSDGDLYERQSGFLAPHLPPELYAVNELHGLSLKDFVDEKVPESVRAVSYLLEVVAEPLAKVDADRICDALLGLS